MSTGKIQFAEQDGVFVLKFTGEIRLTFCSALDAAIEHMFMASSFSSVIVDLTEATSLDSTTLGLLAKLSILHHQKTKQVPTLVSTCPDVTRQVTSMGFEQVFNIVTQPLGSLSSLNELPMQPDSEAAIRAKVIEAHQILMSLNEPNRRAFRDLVSVLEREV